MLFQQSASPSGGFLPIGASAQDVVVLASGNPLSGNPFGAGGPLFVPRRTHNQGSIWLGCALSTPEKLLVPIAHCSANVCSDMHLKNFRFRGEPMLQYGVGRTAALLALGTLFAIIGESRAGAQTAHSHGAAAGRPDEAQTGGPSPSPAGASTYFVDVKNGDTLQPNTIIHFGLKGMGVAPAGVVKPNSGHHHLLIDAELPPLNKPVPNDPQHLHFGAGQTEAEVTLTPGQHTLQLLLADKDHIPHNPPVMSERITVNVADSGQPTAAAGREPAAQGARLYFEAPSNGSCVQQKFVVKFGLSGMGVAPAGFDKKNTGHHHLIVDSDLPALDRPIPSDENHLHFGTGQTEAEVTLQPGPHKLQLLFADSRHIPHDPPLLSKPISVFVGTCRPKKIAHRYRRLHAKQRHVE